MKPGLVRVLGLAGVWGVLAAFPPGVVASSAGQLYVFGENNFGQLGSATNNGTIKPNPTPASLSLPGATGPVVQVAAGGGHSLVVTSTGQLYAFGFNQFGELGNATNNGAVTSNPTPALVSLPGATGPVVQAAAGGNHSLALTSTGQVYAFGNNQFGQLGSQSNDDPNPTPALVSLPGATGPAVQVAAGSGHSVVVTSTGQLYAFGKNLFGQLGSSRNAGTATPNPTPALVLLPGATGPVVHVSASNGHTLVVTSTGQLYAFGDNEFGDLGSTTNNGTVNPNPTPALVSLPGATGPVVQVGAGTDHSLAVTSTGQLYAFGLNQRGQLGIGTSSGTSNANPTPALVSLPGATGPVVRVAAGNRHSLAVTSTGQLYAFGDNFFGQLGGATNSGTGNPNPTPALVSLPGGARAGTIAAGPDVDHSLVVGAGDPVIFVHGFLGSQIFCGSTQTWPDLPFPDFAKMSLGSDGVSDAGCGPMPGQLVLSALGSSVYDTTVNFLQGVAGSDAYFYAWDWRKDPQLALPGLDALIERARCGGTLLAGASTCANPVSQKVVLMAHSMGGLVTRLYVENPAFAAKVERVVTIGTPYWGSPKSIFPFAYGVETPNSSAFDAVLPNSGLKAFARYLQGLFFLWPSASYGGWLHVVGRQPAPLDTAGLLRLISDGGGNPRLLTNGLAVHASVLDRFPTASGVDYQTVVGSGVPTIGAVTITPNLARMHGFTGQDLVDVTWVNGDGTVPLKSAVAATPADHVHYVCGIDHVPLPGDSSVDQRVQGFLLSGDPIDDSPAPAAGLCPLNGTQVSLYSLAPSGFARDDVRVQAVASGAGSMTLAQAVNAGFVHAIQLRREISLASTTRQPVTLSLTPRRVVIRVAAITDGKAGPSRDYGPIGTGGVTLSLGGTVTIVHAGKVIRPHRADQKPPRTTVVIKRAGRRFRLRFIVHDASLTTTYIRIGKRILRVRRGTISLTRAQLHTRILVQSIDAFGNVEKPHRFPAMQ